MHSSVKAAWMVMACLVAAAASAAAAQSGGDPPGWRPSGPASVVPADKAIPGVAADARPLGRFSGRTWANALALCAASHKAESPTGEDYYRFQLPLVRRLITDRGMNGMQAESFANSLMTRNAGEARILARVPELLADFRADCDGMLAEHVKVR